jgi:hypothetical protein
MPLNLFVFVVYHFLIKVTLSFSIIATLCNSLYGFTGPVQQHLSLFHPPSQTKPGVDMHLPTNLTMRIATRSDLDALTWIGTSSFKKGSAWHYRYPYAGEFPEEHQKFSRARYSEWLDLAETPQCTIMVVESPSIEDPCVKKVVSMSIWRLPVKGGDGKPDDKCSFKFPTHLIPEVYSMACIFISLVSKQMGS